MKSKKQKWPKKAKLITDGGFYKIIPLKVMVPRIIVPIVARVKLTSILFDLAEPQPMDITFDFQEVKGGYGIYRQSNRPTLEIKTILEKK